MAGLYKRGRNYYALYYVGGSKKRVSLNTQVLQVAKEKIRQLESAQIRGDNNPFPTKTPLAEIVDKYVKHIRNMKTEKSAQTDVYYLRSMFGTICSGLEITSRKTSLRAKKRPPRKGNDRRFRDRIIEASYLEQITTADISEFIAHHVQSRSLAPKTANRYREIMSRLFNWAMDEAGVKMPSDKNPASKVSKYKEHAPVIHFLNLKQIDSQLITLNDKTQLQTMVAMLIYAGMRREELLWLTLDDIDLNSGVYGIIRIQAKTIAGQFWEPKTKRNRAVPISSSLRFYLDRYAPKPSKGRWFFPSPKSQSHYDPDNFSRDLREANKKKGLKWTCLGFRHTFGSILAMNGESLYKISTLMGNSPEICRRHYAALIPETMADSVEFSQSVNALLHVV